MMPKPRLAAQVAEHPTPLLWEVPISGEVVVGLVLLSASRVLLEYQIPQS